MRASAAPEPAVWRIRRRVLPLSPLPLLMGVVNVTPDSFSDGGAHADPARAIAHGLALGRAGAALLDIGGESTRPGAAPVSEAEELDRVVPVIEGLVRETDLPLSVDTTKPAVARAALAAGAHIVNDVSALRFAPELAALTAETGAGLVLMHMRGEPRTMQRDLHYDDLFGEIGAALTAAARMAQAAGVPRASIVLDPGIGFGKTAADSWRLLAGVDRLTALGYPILIGHSRKSFLDPERRVPPREREVESVTAGVLAALGGAAVLRVHDVEAHARALVTLARHLEARQDGPTPAGRPARRAG